MATTQNTEYIRAKVSKEEKQQVKKVAQHYGMSVDQLIRALIKREALKII